MFGGRASFCVVELPWSAFTAQSCLEAETLSPVNQLTLKHIPLGLEFRKSSLDHKPPLTP